MVVQFGKDMGVRKGRGERVSHAAVWQKRVLDRNGKCKGPQVKVWQAGGQRGGQVSRAE